MISLPTQGDKFARFDHGTNKRLFSLARDALDVYNDLPSFEGEAVLSMKFSALCPICCLLLIPIVGTPAVRGAGIDKANEEFGVDERNPAELYLNAYRLCREAESLAVQQNYASAIKKGILAERILARIVRDFPSWNANIVGTRRNLLAKNMEEYRRKSREASIPTRRRPGNKLDRVPDVIERNSSAPTLPSYEEWTAQEKKTPNKGTVSGTSSYIGNKTPSVPVNYDEVYEELQKTKVELRSVVNAYKQVQEELNATKRQFLVAEDKQKAHRNAYDQLKNQIETERAAGNEVVRSLTDRLTKMEGDYRFSESRRVAAESRVQELEQELSQTKSALDAVTKERDDLAKECRQLRAIVELNSPEKTKALLDQNLTLASQLQQAKDRIAELEAQATANADQTELLQNSLNESRAEIVKLKEEMAALYDENMGYRRRISDLSTQLTNLEADLESRANDPELDSALVEENKILREIVAKQKRTLKTQQQGRKLLIDTYAAQNQKDPAMVEALKKIEEESTVELTPAEMELIRAVAGEETPTDNANEKKLTAMEDQAARAVRATLEIEALGKGAEDAFAKGRYGAAEQLYRTLLDRRPDHLPALVNMGTILMQRNKPTDAVESFKKAITLSPDLAVAYYLCGSALYRANRDEEAIGMFRKSVELDPAHADSFFYLGNLEGLMGETDKALSHLAAAVRLNPELADAHYNMARLYAEAGKIPDACRAYDRAVQAGATPDPEFDTFLRNHPNRTQALGEDLVTAPQKEGDQPMRDEKPETQQSHSKINPEWGIRDERSAEQREPRFKEEQVRISRRKKKLMRRKLREPRRLRVFDGDTWLLKEKKR